MSISNAQAELAELSESVGANPLFGPKTVLSAHWYLTDVTDLVRANLRDGWLVFPYAREETHEPANKLFLNPHKDTDKALVMTWIDENMELQKRAFQQADIQNPSQWGCKLWED